MAYSSPSYGGGNPNEEKKAVPPLVVIAAIVVLILVVGVLAYMNLVPRRTASASGPEAKLSNEEWIQKKARESQGDFAKLKPEDQSRLQSMTYRNGPQMLQQAYQQLQNSPGSGAPR